ncbi:X-ray repair cross-complementing protein 5 [Coccomyxa sp. Obi]|nr:X-ray repair cross-complementing protein 5 [Coccomyxa sp. Obi]
MAKSLTVFAIDVGPHMHAYADIVAETLRTLFLSKALNKPRDECSILYYGTTGTKNMVHDEMAAQGDPGEYLHITVQQPLQPPNANFLMLNMPKGGGNSDFVDAVTVAADSINRALQARPELEKANVSKEIVLLSNFHAKVREEGIDDFVESLVESLQSTAVSLHVISLDNAASGRQEEKEVNMTVLRKLLTQVKHKVTYVQRPAGLLGLFKCKEYSNTAYYAGPFTIGNMMTVRVKIAKKAKKETLPATGLYSEKSRAADASHDILREREYKDASDPDSFVPPEERVKAYKYGKQYVPVQPEDEAYLAYRPDRGISLMGFLDAASIPQHYHMKDPWVMVPEKGNERAGLAMSALVRAMARKEQVAVILFVPRVSDTGGANAATCAGYPLLGNGQQPDCLVLNHLPFAEDLRVAKFASLDEKPDLMPSASQLDQMRSLVETMDLFADIREALLPDMTANPIIHRFYSYMASQAADKDYPLPAPHEDVLINETFEPQPAVIGKAASVLHMLPEHLHVEKKELVLDGAELKEAAKSVEETAFSLEGAAASSVETVGTSDPVSDFEVLLKQGKPDVAFSSLPQAVFTLVDNSLGERNYDKAVRAVVAMRTAAEDHEWGQTFNTFLAELASKYEHDRQHRNFWQFIIRERVMLIGNPEEAEGFFKQYSGAKEEEAAAPMEVNDDEEDEFAGMD